MNQMTNVNSQFGAPMGRSEGSVKVPKGEVRVFQVAIDSGGYDDGGAYWGIGEPLFCCEDEDGEFCQFLRAETHKDAQAKLQKLVSVPVTFVNEPDMDAFVQAYLEAALFFSPDDREGNDEAQAISVEDFHEDTLAKAREDCANFYNENAEDLAHLDEAHGGWDFWASRNHQGTGFLDRDYLPEEVGHRLMEACEKFGEIDIYSGDDDKLYFS